LKYGTETPRPSRCAQALDWAWPRLELPSTCPRTGHDWRRDAQRGASRQGIAAPRRSPRALAGRGAFVCGSATGLLIAAPMSPAVRVTKMEIEKCPIRCDPTRYWKKSAPTVVGAPMLPLRGILWPPTGHWASMSREFPRFPERPNLQGRNLDGRGAPGPYPSVTLRHFCHGKSGGRTARKIWPTDVSLWMQVLPHKENRPTIPVLNQKDKGVVRLELHNFWLAGAFFRKVRAYGCSHSCGFSALFIH